MKKQEKKDLFALQIAVSTRKIKTSPYNFKGVKNVFMKQKSEVYKYYTCKSNSIEYTEFCAVEVLKKYPDAFIVSLKK